MKNISIFVGRFNPVHIGHLNTIKFLSDQTEKNHGIAYIGLTITSDTDKNPLKFKQKLKYMKLATRDFKNVEVSEEPVFTIYEFIRDKCFECQENGGGKVTFYAGSDRIESYRQLCKDLLKKYQDRDELQDIELDVVETMERGTFQSYSATKMREHVRDDDLVSFIDHCPFGTEEDNEKYGTQMFNDIKAVYSKGSSQLHGQVSSEQAYEVVKDMAKKVSEHINELTGEPDKLYILGGAVRDELMGKTPNDYDLLTTMYYKEYAKLFNTDDIRFRGPRIIVVPVIDGEQYETGCLTKGMDVEDLLYKSDLTMGAIARDVLTGELVDPFGGVQDIKKQVVNLTELMKNEMPKGKQPGPVMRCVRFISTFGWPPTKDTMETLKAFARATKGKLNVSQNEWNKEWGKICKKGVQQDAIKLFKEIGLYNDVKARFLDKEE